MSIYWRPASIWQRSYNLAGKISRFIQQSGAVGHKVHVMQSSTNSVKIETDDNLMQYIDVYVEGNTLHIKSKTGYNLNPSKDIIAYVSAPAFKDISVSGSGDIIGDNAISGNDPLDACLRFR